MAKVRFLLGAYIPSLGIVANFNDEHDVEDEKQVKQLVADGIVDVLVEEKSASKRKGKAVDAE